MDTNQQQDHFFIDGVANLSLTAGAFRFDLVSILPDNAQASDSKKERKQTLKKHAHVVMTPQGYAQMLVAMQDLLNKAKEQGILRVENQPDNKK